jgi:hypothetical protein
LKVRTLELKEFRVPFIKMDQRRPCRLSKDWDSDPGLRKGFKNYKCCFHGNFTEGKKMIMTRTGHTIKMTNTSRPLEEPLRKGFGYNFEGFRAYMQYHRKGMSSK